MVDEMIRSVNNIYCKKTEYIETLFEGNVNQPNKLKFQLGSIPFSVVTACSEPTESSYGKYVWRKQEEVIHLNACTKD
jgi:hypothetical protein